MGQAISWIGVRGRDKASVLDELGLVETGAPDPDGRAKFSLAETSRGWLVIRARAFTYASPKRIAALSKGGEAIGCAVEEHVMFSGVRGYRDGGGAWWVIHDAQDGRLNLTVGGKPPPQLAGIRKRLMAEQRKEGGAKAEVDLVFDIPVELSESICGYRHDGEDPPPAFTVVKPRGGLLARLLGGR